MEGLTALFALGAVLVVAAFVAQPLLSRRGGAGRGGRRRTASILRLRADLLAERNRIYAEIRDLDFDYKTNKLTDEDYAAQRYALVARGVDLLKRLDDLPAVSASSDNDAIEAAIASVRGGGSPVELAGAGGSKARAAFCPQCGQAVQPGDRFCSVCGARL
jgi:hypothetical protein